jgi:lincosamide and streptogramin A transport system ATP-binding/permease protein
MSLISVSNLTFSYEGSYDNIFENVSFQIDTDWKLGIIGRNGRGKTTLLNLLQGKYEYKGCISANVTFEYFPCQVPDKYINTLDIADCIVPRFQLWELQRELSLLDVSNDVLYRPFITLSNGEQTKVLIALLFLKEDSYLLIDEPTNHLDMKARQIVSHYLKSKKSFILVSHDREFLDNCIDHILAINKTNIEIQKGNFSTWWLNKERQDNYELAKNKKLKNDIKRLESAVMRTSKWSEKAERAKYNTTISGVKPDRGYIGHKAAKMMKRSKAIKARQEKAIKEKSGLLKNIEESEPLKLSPLAYHSNRLISLKNVSLFYNSRNILKDISFTIERGERVALYGKNGSGKTSIIKLILGQDIQYKGTFIKGSNIITSYVSQDTAFLQGSLDEYAALHNIDRSLFKAILRKLDFSRIQFEKDMSDYSAGQKKKVLIAKSLCEKAHLYIWDEPLNYIDVISRMQIEELLTEYCPTILFVEHDRAFCEKIATKIIRL